MASLSASSIILLIIICLAVQCWLAKSNDFLSPILSPIFDDVCKEIGCGKGTCKASENSTVGYVCECEPGWKQARFEKDDALSFMPCVIPNCTLNFSCMEGPSPAQEKQKQANESIFDPCYWADCGGGMCNKTSVFTHRCECSEGYYNLLNVAAFPCFRDCALGMDCSGLGITTMNRSVSPPPSLPGNSHGISVPAVNYKLVFLTSLYFAVAL